MKMMINTTLFDEFELHANANMHLKKKYFEFFSQFFLCVIFYIFFTNKSEK